MKPSPRKSVLLLVLGVIALTIGLYIRRENGGEPNRQSADGSPVEPQAAKGQKPGAVSPVGQVGSDSARGPAAAPTIAPSAQRVGAAGSSRDLVLQFFKSNWPGDWTVQTLPSGEISSVLGGLITIPGASEESRFSIAQGIAGALGMRASDLGAQARERFESPTGGRVVYPQTFENYEVYQGGVTLVSRPQDGAVYVVNASVKDLSQVSLSQNMNAAEAVQVAQSYLKNPSARLLGNAPERPVIWAEDPTHAQLAYVLSFSIEKPDHDEVRVIVGLSEQKVLYSRSILKH